MFISKQFINLDIKSINYRNIMISFKNRLTLLAFGFVPPQIVGVWFSGAAGVITFIPTTLVKVLPLTILGKVLILIVLLTCFDIDFYYTK